MVDPQDTGDAHETAQQHDARDSEFSLAGHLQFEDLWDGNQHDKNVVDHVDDAQSEEELLYVDAAARGSTELVPVKGYRLAGVGHDGGDDDWVRNGEEEGEVEREAEEQVVGYKYALVEEEDGDFGCCAGEGVDVGVAVNDLAGLDGWWR